MALRLFTSVLTSAHENHEAMGDLDALFEEGFDLPSDRYLVETPKGNYLQNMVARLDWYKSSKTEFPFSKAENGFDMSPRSQPSQLMPTLSAGGNLVFTKASRSSSLSSTPTNNSLMSSPATPGSPVSPVTPSAKSNKKRTYTCVEDEQAFWEAEGSNSRRRTA